MWAVPGLTGGQELLFLHRVSQGGKDSMSWVTGLTPSRGAGRGYLPEGVMRKWEVVKCPLGGLGERLLVDLAELNFHVCI